MKNSPEGSQSSQTGLITAILFSVIVVAGSLFYLGYQSSFDFSSPAKEESSDDYDDLLEQLDDLDLATAQALLREYNNRVSEDYETIVDDDPMYGDPDAPITLVEFSDYQCPYCQRHYTQTYPQLLSEYIKMGKVKHVYRDYPLSFHTDAKKAANAAECAREQGGDQKYFEIYNQIFGGITAKISDSTLSGYARKAGLELTAFDECVSSEKYNDEIDADMMAGANMGITGTPGFIITNGEKSIRLTGAQPFSAFSKVIEDLLN